MYQDPSLALRMTVGAGRDSACWQRIAVSGQPIAVSAFGCPLLAPGGRLPADRYLQADGALSACTKILRCAQDDCERREGGCLKSDVWCLNGSVLSGIPLSGQRIAVSGRLSSCPAGDPVTLSLYSSPKAIPPPSARRAADPFYTTRRRQAATTLGAKGPVHLPL